MERIINYYELIRNNTPCHCCCDTQVTTFVAEKGSLSRSPKNSSFPNDLSLTTKMTQTPQTPVYKCPT